MKLNRWQALGVWLSTFWIVGIVMFVHHNLALGVVPIAILWLTGYAIMWLRRLFRQYRLGK